MKTRILLGITSLFLLGCWLTVPATPVVLTRPPNIWLTPSPVNSTISAENYNSPAGSATPRITETPEQLLDNIANFSNYSYQDFSSAEITTWRPTQNPTPSYQLPVQVDEVSNLPLISGMTFTQQRFLVENGFVILRTHEDRFSDIRDNVSGHLGQPYFLTTDAAYYAADKVFDETLIALEKEELRPRMISITRATLDEVLSYIPLLKDTALEKEAVLAAAYLSVALKLFDPQAPIDPLLKELVTDQVEQVLAGEGVDSYVLFPGIQENFETYQPTGHYAGEPELKTYFRGMTWFGRVHFDLNQQGVGLTPPRIPLIITLALQNTMLDTGTGLDAWKLVNEAITFMNGSSAVHGPVEYIQLMEKIYGTKPAILDLKNERTWELFLTLNQGLPAQQTYYTIVNSLLESKNKQGWRFMGSRLNLDDFILQNLVYERVGTPENPREFPSGLDVMAALGSPVASLSLNKSGANRYQNFDTQLSSLQETIRSKDEPFWINTSSSTRLFVSLPQLDSKTKNQPAFMHTKAWTYKDLNSALGNWALDRHNLSTSPKPPETSNSNLLSSRIQPPGYVEPNPLVFYRLSYLANSIVKGLSQRGMTGNPSDQSGNLEAYLEKMKELGEQFQQLGDIAAKELASIPLDKNDYAAIQTFLVPVEAHSQNQGFSNNDPPVPATALVPGAGDRFLRVGIGNLDRIYVVVPLEGRLQIAQGGVFSYYEFPKTSNEKMTDRLWRQLLTSKEPDLPEWSTNYLLPGGYKVDHLAFRFGYTYSITHQAENLGLHESPSIESKKLRNLKPGELVEIIDGPVLVDGQTWWKFLAGFHDDNPIKGWALENQAGYQLIWDK